MLSFPLHLSLPGLAWNCCGRGPRLGSGTWGGAGRGAYGDCGLLAVFGPTVSPLTIAAFPDPVAAAICD